MKRAIKERGGLQQRLKTLQQKRASNKNLIWFHVASAGEMMQAQPVIEKCLQQQYECLLTFSSPTGKDWLERLQFKQESGLFCDYLPLDCPIVMWITLKLFKPSAMVYVHSELIPNLTWIAYFYRIPQFLISAVMRPDSPRVQSWFVRHFYQALYKCLTGIFTASTTDQELFLKLLPKQNIQFLGETRFDSVLERKKRLRPPQIPFSLQHKTVLIFGSSWQQDEQIYMPALQNMLHQHKELVAFIAPHEIDEAHLAQLEEALSSFHVARFSNITTDQHTKNMNPPQVLLIDCVGILSSVYQLGSLAYVGGGFSTGVHNIIEPCAMGLPVIFGRLFQNSAEARQFVKQDFAWSIDSTQALQKQLEILLNHPHELSKLGDSALGNVEQLSGASQACFEQIHNTLQNHRGGRND